MAKIVDIREFIAQHDDGLGMREKGICPDCGQRMGQSAACRNERTSIPHDEDSNFPHWRDEEKSHPLRTPLTRDDIDAFESILLMAALKRLQEDEGREKREVVEEKVKVVTTESTTTVTIVRDSADSSIIRKITGWLRGRGL